MSIVRIHQNLLCSSHIRLLLGARFGPARNATEPQMTQSWPRQSIVAYSTGSFLNESLIAPAQRYDWKQIVRDAEKTVDYPTSFANLRWLLSDNVANVGLQLRKLAASSNLLHRTARYTDLHTFCIIYHIYNIYGPTRCAEHKEIETFLMFREKLNWLSHLTLCLTDLNYVFKNVSFRISLCSQKCYGRWLQRAHQIKQDYQK